MQDTTGFSPATAIVTASDSGIGKATAVALAKAGMDVGVTWHSDKAGAEATAEEIRSLGRKAVVRQLDTTELRAAGGVIEELAEELGGVDVFVSGPPAFAAKGYLAPFDPLAQDLLARGRKVGFALQSPPADRVLFRSGEYYVIKVRKPQG